MKMEMDDGSEEREVLLECQDCLGDVTGSRGTGQVRTSMATISATLPIQF